MEIAKLLEDLPVRSKRAVAHYWRTRATQADKQKLSGTSDQGSRGATTGGAQMDEFLGLLAHYLEAIGIPRHALHFHQRLELPGYFRPTKKWDLLVVLDHHLIAGLETKSQVGSFGNNFNNRTEEAMGSALDLWTAHREGAFGSGLAPWLGYLFLLQDCPASQKPVRTDEPHFKVFPEFKNASYAQRYEIFCRKLVRERHYTASAFLLADVETGPAGAFTEPAPDLALTGFVTSLLNHARNYIR